MHANHVFVICNDLWPRFQFPEYDNEYSVEEIGETEAIFPSIVPAKAALVDSGSYQQPRSSNITIFSHTQLRPCRPLLFFMRPWARACERDTVHALHVYIIAPLKYASFQQR